MANSVAWTAVVTNNTDGSWERTISTSEGLAGGRCAGKLVPGERDVPAEWCAGLGVEPANAWILETGIDRPFTRLLRRARG